MALPCSIPPVFLFRGSFCAAPILCTATNSTFQAEVAAGKCSGKADPDDRFREHYKGSR